MIIAYSFMYMNKYLHFSSVIDTIFCDINSKQLNRHVKLGYNLQL